MRTVPPLIRLNVVAAVLPCALLLASAACSVRDLGVNADECLPLEDGTDGDVGDGDGEGDGEPGQGRRGDEAFGRTADGEPCLLAPALPENGGDGEGEVDDPQNALIRAQCTELVVHSCGIDNACQGDAGCRAALLLARYEAEACSAALEDPRGFPGCRQGSCADLAVKVCGTLQPAGSCEDAPGCGPARVLQKRADDGDASALASCTTALSDETFFPPCAAR